MVGRIDKAYRYHEKISIDHFSDMEELKKVIREKLVQFKNRGCDFCQIRCEGGFLSLTWSCKNQLNQL
jgi:hypothetical protein